MFRQFTTTLATTVLLAAAFSAITPTTAQAGWNILSKSGHGQGGRDDSITPPDNYASQWWVHPSGCEYSRAGRPGEVVWYVIINTIGKRNCPSMIVQKAWPGAYQN